MRVDYSDLWLLLQSKGITRKELRSQTQLSSSTYTKLVQNRNISTASLVKICEYLQCQIGDVVKVVVAEE